MQNITAISFLSALAAASKARSKAFIHYLRFTPLYTKYVPSRLNQMLLIRFSRLLFVILFYSSLYTPSDYVLVKDILLTRRYSLMVLLLWFKDWHIFYTQADDVALLTLSFCASPAQINCLYRQHIDLRLRSRKKKCMISIQVLSKTFGHSPPVGLNEAFRCVYARASFYTAMRQSGEYKIYIFKANFTCTNIGHGFQGAITAFTFIRYYTSSNLYYR